MSVHQPCARRGCASGCGRERVREIRVLSESTAAALATVTPTERCICGVTKQPGLIFSRAGRFTQASKPARPPASRQSSGSCLQTTATPTPHIRIHHVRAQAAARSAFSLIMERKERGGMTHIGSGESATHGTYIDTDNNTQTTTHRHRHT